MPPASTFVRANPICTTRCKNGFVMNIETKGKLPCSPKELTTMGLPDWITPEWVGETKRVWGRFYGNLTNEEAIGIIMAMDRIYDLIKED